MPFTENRTDSQPLFALHSFFSDRTTKKKKSYVGVSYFKKTKTWRSKIFHNNKELHLGYYKLETDAALAYDVAAKQTRGTSAKTNFTN